MTRSIRHIALLAVCTAVVASGHLSAGLPSPAAASVTTATTRASLLEPTSARPLASLRVIPDKRLVIDVTPNLPGHKAWTVRVEKKAGRTWRKVCNCRTSGSQETIALRARPGRYRARVLQRKRILRSSTISFSFPLTTPANPATAPPPTPPLALVASTTPPTTTDVEPPPSPTGVAPSPVGVFPDASNTGVPAGVTLRSSGAVTVTTAGTVIDGLDIQGNVYINASNVTLKRSRVTSGAFYAIQVASGRTGVVIEDVEVNGTGKSSGNCGIAGPATVTRANIYGVENGVVPYAGSVVRDSYIHHLVAPGSPHYDGIQIDGGHSNILIQHNTINMAEHTQTAAVMTDNYFGPTNNITVTGNRLLGGGYTVYADGQFRADTMTGIAFTNNRIGRGQWGYILSNNAQVTWTGNVDDTTSKTI